LTDSSPNYKMKRNFFLLVLIALISACANAPKQNYMPSETSVSEPPLNSINTTQVGDIMLKQGKYTEHDAIHVTQKISAGLYNIFPGFYLKTGENESVESYYPGGNNAGRVEKSPLADNWSSVIIKKGGSPQICVLTVYGTAVTTCASAAAVQRKKTNGYSEDSFQQTLIYSGKVGSKINIGYRESSNNFARPAFSNDVEYDLAESNVIGYKGSQLKIIEATNQHIKYQVIRNFKPAER